MANMDAHRVPVITFLALPPVHGGPILVNMDAHRVPVIAFLALPPVHGGPILVKCPVWGANRLENIRFGSKIRAPRNPPTPWHGTCPARKPHPTP